MDDLNLDYSIFKGKSAVINTNKLNNSKERRYTKRKL